MILPRRIMRIALLVVVGAAVQIVRAHLVNDNAEYRLTHGPVSLANVAHADVPVGMVGGDGGYSSAIGGDDSDGGDCD